MSGSSSISNFTRVMQVVVGEEGEFHIQLEGFRDREARPCLRLCVTGAVRLICQRCLEPLALEVTSDRSFVLVEREEDMLDLAEEGDDMESLLADDKLDTLGLAEDEILLQIPIAPMHDTNTCTPPQWAQQSRNSSTPFGALGALTNTKD